MVKTFLKRMAAYLWRRTQFLRRPWRRKYDALQAHQRSLIVTSLEAPLQELIKRSQWLDTRSQWLDTRTQWLDTQVQGLNAQVQGLACQIQGLNVQVGEKGSAQLSRTEALSDALTKGLEELHNRTRTLASVVDLNLHNLQREVSHLRARVEADLIGEHLHELTFQTQRLVTANDLNLDAVTRELLRLQRQIENAWELLTKNGLLSDQSESRSAEDYSLRILEQPARNDKAA